MMQGLRCYSFHSVKGGVGKSTLSTLTAVALAHEYPDKRVYLVDMDLTGTSLADVLPLEAPRWESLGDEDPIDLRKLPDGFHASEESRSRIDARGASELDAKVAVAAPFLNDWLLFVPESWEEDLDPRVIAWRLAEGPENLLVFPSSALPRDLERALSVIYDEDHAAFLESRLEWFLSALVPEAGSCFVVFDTPPTIPGLSRSVLGLAYRLSGSSKQALSDDTFIPPRLEPASIDWRAFLVATQDLQDIRAAARWLDLVGPEDKDVMRLILNRVAGDEQQRKELHLRALGDEVLNPLVTNPLWVAESNGWQEIFRIPAAPLVSTDLLGTLGIERVDDG